MRAEDMGFDTKTGTHSKRLTTTEDRFLGILWTDHVGAENKISADGLAICFMNRMNGLDYDKDMLPVVIKNAREKWPTTLARYKRDVRYLHNHLLKHHDSVPLLSKAGNGGGYWIAADDTEASQFYDTFRQRGMTGMVKASRGKKSVMVDTMKQLAFEFEELADHTEQTGLIHRRADLPVAIEVVDAFLERMSKDPEKFADGLRKIGRKYGSVLLPRDRVAAMKAQADVMKVHAEKFQELLTGLTG